MNENEKEMYLFHSVGSKINIFNHVACVRLCPVFTCVCIRGGVNQNSRADSTRANPFTTRSRRCSWRINVDVHAAASSIAIFPLNSTEDQFINIDKENKHLILNDG